MGIKILERFPENLRSQIATLEHGGRRYLPYVFTEQGVSMLSAILKDLGKKWFAFSRLDIEPFDILSRLIE